MSRFLTVALVFKRKKTHKILTGGVVCFPRKLHSQSGSENRKVSTEENLT